MQLTCIEQAIVNNLRALPLNEQQLLLTSLREKVQKKSAGNDSSFNHFRQETAGSALKEFLKRYENDPIDIDTSIFDRDRAFIKEREIDL